MAKNDTEKILEAISSLKKEQEKEIQILKKEQEEIRKENQEIKNLLKKSMIVSNEDSEEYYENFKIQNKPKEANINKNKAMTKKNLAMDEIISYKKRDISDEMDLTPKTELYSIPQTNNKTSSHSISDIFINKKLMEKTNDINEQYKKKYNALKNDLTDKKDDMSIISFLARSDKRVQILKSLNNSDKIPSMISKEIGDSSHHVSKYLKTLKEKGLVVCLNEDDKRFRFYSITSKGKKYLKIIQEENY